ncbi:hypothetical protein [Lysobacter sp. Root604]|uniref:hypothetical protein n=1 Tax=Lysobacter sp. Root604 TaxID=1736568 RepID=UPI001F15DFF1|nr:hypothetical protein [Lysobacter sp. Root604]
MSEPLRHRDTGKWLGSFADRVEVSCPRCGHGGVVRAGGESAAWFVCAHCGLEARSERSDWFGKVRLHGKRSCGHCGHQWVRVDHTRSGSSVPAKVSEWRPTPMPDLIAASCSVCKRDSNVVIDAYRERDGEAHDPHFGLPLRLIERTRVGLLWAYNGEHIDELQRYVAADLRERRGAMSNSTMASRLPTWMKLARHRARVLRGLDRLAAKLVSSRHA